jgi:hypothetical protein
MEFVFNKSLHEAVNIRVFNAAASRIEGNNRDAITGICICYYVFVVAEGIFFAQSNRTFTTIEMAAKSEESHHRPYSPEHDRRSVLSRSSHYSDRSQFLTLEDLIHPAGHAPRFTRLPSRSPAPSSVSSHTRAPVDTRRIFSHEPPTAITSSHRPPSLSPAPTRSPASGRFTEPPQGRRQGSTPVNLPPAFPPRVSSPFQPRALLPAALAGGVRPDPPRTRSRPAAAGDGYARNQDPNPVAMTSRMWSAPPEASSQFPRFRVLQTSTFCRKEHR